MESGAGHTIYKSTVTKDLAILLFYWFETSSTVWIIEEIA